jgi:AraC family transcriptional regulator
MMEPRIEHLRGKKLAGKRMTMSLAVNRTGELWRSLMPRRREITNNIGADLYSLQVYPEKYFEAFDPRREFQKWALVEVKDFGDLPDDIETFNLPGGLYAVFLHRGPASEGPKTFQYIFTKWLPRSLYVLDDRPHFEILGEKYKNEAPDSEEEIWVPVKLRTA